MNWQRHNYTVRLRDDSSWQRTSPIPSQLKPRALKTPSKADVNEDEEIYEDGTSITNITVAGVKDKIAMFGTGGKPVVSSKPVPAVLQRFQEKAAEAGQANFSTFGKKSESSAGGSTTGGPGGRNFSRTPSTGQARGTTPTSALRPKFPPNVVNSPPSQPAWKKKATEAKTDQNQNVTSSSPNNQNVSSSPKVPVVSSSPKVPVVSSSPKAPFVSSPPKASVVSSSSKTPVVTSSSPVKKRGSVNIPAMFQNDSTVPSTERRISIDEKPSVPNGSVASVESPVSPVNKTDNNDDSGPKIDFRANLRPTAGKGSGAPKPIEIHPRQRTPSENDKPISPPGTKGSVNFSPTSQPTSKPFKRITPGKTIITRSEDGKKFERVPKSTIITQQLAPIKPLKPRDINVNDIIEQFKKAYEDFKNANEELYDDVGNYIRPMDEEEEYDDVENTIENRQSKRSSKRPVSEIQPWSEEDELGSGGSASASGSGGSAAVIGTTDGELYDEGAPAESDELYEPLPDEDLLPEPVVDNSVVDKKEQERREKEAAERKKKEEKERKEREKEEKKEQARREKEEKARLERERKKEKEEKELRKKLKMTGDEQPEAQGVVKQAGKGGKLDLAVQPGEKVDILRMTDNPKGKWLVKNKEGSYGYVESDNILIETPSIKQHSEDLASKIQAMKLVDNPHLDGEEGQEEMYEDLDGYQDGNEEIYEECS